MTNRYLFLGPSAPGMKPPPGITLLPPVAAGDLLALPLTAGDAVGIVDGYFHQVRAVPHKEILAVLDRGVEVLGAASMGALRAAELDTLGMRGVGQVYQDYRAGRIDADDEVALLHGPPESDYRAMSEPLVDIRATLAGAVRDGVCDAATADRIVRALQAIPYPRRCYRRFPELADAVGVDARELEALGRHCALHRSDVKRADALALIDLLSVPGARSDRPTAPRGPVPRTAYLAAWEDRARRAPGTDDDGERPGSLAALRVLQLFSDGFPAVRRRRVLALIAQECARSCGSPPTDHDSPPTDHDDIALAIAHGVHRGVYRDPGPDPGPEHGGGGEDDFGFLRPWLTEDEAAGSGRRERLEIFLSRSFQIDPGIAWESAVLDDLEHTPEFSRALDLAAACLRSNEELSWESPEFDLSQLSSQLLAERLTGRWGCTRAEADQYALDRGFDALDAAVEAARPYHGLLAHRPTVPADVPAALSSELPSELPTTAADLLGSNHARA